MNPVQRVATFVRKAFTLRFGGSRWGWLSQSLGGTTYDYRSSAGDGRTNAIVQACVRWACRNFPEAPVIVQERSLKDGALTPLFDHPLARLMERPNPFYSGQLLWQAMLADWMISGNGYWIKIKAQMGNPVQLWWVPSWLMEPAWPDDGSVFISHYEYRLSNVTYDLPVGDVVHFRDGFDPNNIRKGLSQFAALLREIATDNEAANYTASFLRNMGVPGIVVSPSSDIGISSEEAEEVKAKFDDRFGGDRRGSTLVMEGPTKVDVLSFSPEQMQLADLRYIPEERITAVTGIPAMVTGLGAGLRRSTFNNTGEAREMAYENMIIPTQRLFAADLQAQLVPDFGDPQTLRIAFDLSQVRVLQDDQNELHARVREDLVRGLITRNQALTMLGLDEDAENGEVLYLPTNVKPVLPKDLLKEPEPVPVVPPLGEAPVGEETEEPLPEERPAPRRLAASRNGKDTTVMVPMTVADPLEVERLFADRLHHLNGAGG